MPQQSSLSHSMEDYLETIYRLVSEKKVARVGEIARALNVKTPSVHNAVKNLAGDGLVEHDRYGFVDLTDKGKTVARQIYRRHEVLKEFLVEILGVDPETGEDDACKMEHTVSKQTIERIINFIEFTQICPMGSGQWINRFRQYCEDGTGLERCDECIDECLRGLSQQKKRRADRTTRSLNDLRIGEKGIITRLKGRGDTHRRMLDMGVVPGTVVEVERVAPLGDPIGVRVRGYHLTLRREEAKKILVEDLPTIIREAAAD